MRLYLDSSLLVKLYVPESDSTKLIEGLKRLEARLILTRFQYLEVLTAINRKQFEGSLREDQVDSARHALARDRALGRGFAETKVDMHEVLGRAIKLSDQWARERGGRTLDLVHIAIAQELRVRDFATADNRQGGIARLAGFNVVDPRQH